MEVETDCPCTDAEVRADLEAKGIINRKRDGPKGKPPRKNLRDHQPPVKKEGMKRPPGKDRTFSNASSQGSKGHRKTKGSDGEMEDETYQDQEGSEKSDKAQGTSYFAFEEDDETLKDFRKDVTSYQLKDELHQVRETKRKVPKGSDWANDLEEQIDKLERKINSLKTPGERLTKYTSQLRTITEKISKKEALLQTTTEDLFHLKKEKDMIKAKICSAEQARYASAPLFRQDRRVGKSNQTYF